MKTIATLIKSMREMRDARLQLVPRISHLINATRWGFNHMHAPSAQRTPATRISRSNNGNYCDINCIYVQSAKPTAAIRNSHPVRPIKYW